MATTTVLTCDFIDVDSDSICGAPATERYLATFGKTTYGADFCSDHRADVERRMLRVGIQPLGSRVDSKPRGVYLTASGRTFNATQAREWLLQKGYITSTRGRISSEHRELYASQH